MSYTAKQWRAIKWYLEREQLKPTLSAWPEVAGTTISGVRRAENIKDIVDWYDNWLAKQKREREAQRRQAKKAQR